MSAAEIAIVLLWAGLAAADETAAFQTMLHQPLVSCSVVAAVLGQPVFGLLVGVPLQAVWSGLLPLGATSYPDVPVGSVLGAAAAVLASRAGGAAGAAVAVGLGFGLLAGAAGSGSTRAVRRACARLCRAADRVAARGDAAGLVRVNAAGAGAAFGRGVVVAGAGLAVIAFLSGPAARLLGGSISARGVADPVLGVGMGVLAATFAAGRRRRYAFFVVSAAAAFLLHWKVL